jgi:hypothetical protein
MLGGTFADGDTILVDVIDDEIHLRKEAVETDPSSEEAIATM